MCLRNIKPLGNQREYRTDSFNDFFLSLSVPLISVNAQSRSLDSRITKLLDTRTVRSLTNRHVLDYNRTFIEHDSNANPIVASVSHCKYESESETTKR